jgi:hypothetical protein
VVTGVVRSPWDRRDGETSQAYAAFRQYRDLGPSRRVDRMSNVSVITVQRWSARWDWVARATAWDDEQAMIEDSERLDALRNMHRTHQTAARGLLAVALRALRSLDPETMTAADVVRLVDLGTQLERRTLEQSVPDLLGQGVPGVEDPWDRIAHELSAP